VTYRIVFARADMTQPISSTPIDERPEALRQFSAFVTGELHAPTGTERVMVLDTASWLQFSAAAARRAR
jgi:hypothetical protein